MFKFRIIALECTMVIGSSYFFLPENFITMERSLGNAFDPEQSKSYVSLMKFLYWNKIVKKKNQVAFSKIIIQTRVLLKIISF